MKTFESKLADLVRRLGTDFDGEALATWSALKRLLASQGVTFTDLGDAVEKLATGGLEEAEMKRVFDAGLAKGAENEARKRHEEDAVFGLCPDGSPDWEAVALHMQRSKARLETRHHEFIDKMASRVIWREPSEKEGKYLLSLFRQIGGRIK
jgi:hypothetical protein